MMLSKCILDSTADVRQNRSYLPLISPFLILQSDKKKVIRTKTSLRWMRSKETTLVGVHALIGGKAVDNVESLEVWLYDDTCLQVVPTTKQELAEMITAGERKRLAEHSLLPEVRAAAPEDTLISNSFGCREQIKRNSTRRALHRAEVLLGVCQ